jgi:gliding motility-associated-like protein
MVTWNPLPEFTAHPTDVTCFGDDSGKISITITGKPSDYRYSVDNDLWIEDTVFSKRSGGNYTVWVKNSKSGCVNKVANLVINEPDPITFGWNSIATTSKISNDGEIKVLDIMGGNQPYFYNDIEQLASGFTIPDLAAGFYPIVITDQKGCESEPQSIHVESGDIPNAFSPNGEEPNEVWIVKSLEGRTNCLVRVFDRSGKLVYTDNDGIYDPWDGKLNGKDLPAGTYFYLIQIDKSKGKPVRNTITIVR